MTIEACLADLGSRLGLAELALAANRTCALVFEGKFEVVFEEAPDQQGIYLYCEVGSCPDEGRQGLYEDLLQAQLFGSRTGDACFAIQPDTGRILLTRRLEVSGLDGERLQAALQSLVDWTATWQTEFSGTDGLGGDSDSGDRPPEVMIRV